MARCYLSILRLIGVRILKGATGVYGFFEFLNVYFEKSSIFQSRVLKNEKKPAENFATA